MKIDIDNLSQVALNGDIDAQVQLGNMYRSGQGVDKDWGKACQWYLLAADAGNAHAQYNLGMRYYNGQGVPKDLQQATLWWAKSADQGHTQALYALGFRYLNGDSVARDIDTALEIFEKVATTGLAYAQYNLGKQYYDILRYDKSIYWLQLAAEQDYVQAIQLLSKCYQLGRGVQVDVDMSRQLQDKVARLQHSSLQSPQ